MRQPLGYGNHPRPIKPESLRVGPKNLLCHILISRIVLMKNTISNGEISDFREEKKDSRTIWETETLNTSRAHTYDTLWSAHPRTASLCLTIVPDPHPHPRAILPQPGAPTAVWSGGHVPCLLLGSVLSLHVLLCLMSLRISSKRRKCKSVRKTLFFFKTVFLHHFARITHYYQGSNPHCGCIHVKFKTSG